MSCLNLESPTFHLKNPALQDSYYIFNWDCEHVSQLPNSHKTNEEVYGILSGKGKVIIDGEEITLIAGDWIRISPSAKRQFFAAEDSGISFVCVQTKENSLEKFTANDAVVY